MNKIKKALISVSDKTNLNELVNALKLADGYKLLDYTIQSDTSRHA